MKKVNPPVKTVYYSGEIDSRIIRIKQQVRDDERKIIRKQLETIIADKDKKGWYNQLQEIKKLIETLL